MVLPVALKCQTLWLRLLVCIRPSRHDTQRRHQQIRKQRFPGLDISCFCLYGLRLLRRFGFLIAACQYLQELCFFTADLTGSIDDLRASSKDRRALVVPNSSASCKRESSNCRKPLTSILPTGHNALKDLIV